jgi:hypothetical protein
MKRLVVLGLLATLAIACGSAGGGTATGLYGYVKRGPTMPVCRVGVPCTEPAKGVKLRFSRAGKLAATATTNNRGWYRVVLRPGTYSVSVSAKATAFGPRKASVQSGKMKRRDFLIDTGIR